MPFNDHRAADPSSDTPCFCGAEKFHLRWEHGKVELSASTAELCAILGAGVVVSGGAYYTVLRLLKSKVFEQVVTTYVKSSAAGTAAAAGPPAAGAVPAMMMHSKLVIGGPSAAQYAAHSGAVKFVGITTTAKVTLAAKLASLGASPALIAAIQGGIVALGTFGGATAGGYLAVKIIKAVSRTKGSPQMCLLPQMELPVTTPRCHAPDLPTFSRPTCPGPGIGLPLFNPPTCGGVGLPPFKPPTSTCGTAGLQPFNPPTCPEFDLPIHKTMCDGPGLPS